MGTGNEYKFGPVQDYSIKTNMYGNDNRGFTWGQNGKTPIAGLNLQGHFQIAGDFTSKNTNVNGGSLYLNAPKATGNGPNFFTHGLFFKNGTSTSYSITYGQYPAPGNGELRFRGSTFNFLASKTIFGGNVGIGTNNPKNKLSVNGHIWAKEIKVQLTDGADWVFEEDYDLKPLTEVEAFIKANKHLPEIPSADDFRANDMKISEMTNKLLQKIEELTLYAIEQEKLLKTQNKINQLLEKRITQLEALLN